MIKACKSMAKTERTATDCLTSDFSTISLNGDDLKERRRRNISSHTRLAAELAQITERIKSLHLFRTDPTRGENLLRVINTIKTICEQRNSCKWLEVRRAFWGSSTESLLVLYPFWHICFWPLERGYWQMGCGTASGCHFGVRESKRHTLYTHPSWGKM